MDRAEKRVHRNHATAKQAADNVNAAVIGASLTGPERKSKAGLKTRAKTTRATVGV
jgi:hypothetical protein